jgi:hypothetical protein
LTAITHGASDRPVIGPAVQGLLAAVAIGSITSTARVGSNAAVVCGIVMGIAAALASLGGGCERASLVVFSAVGVIAFFPAAVSFVAGDMCGRAIAAPLRFAMIALLVVLAVMSFVARRLMVGRRPHASIGLSLFGALEILVAAATFIEGSGSRQELVAMAVMVLGAAVLGWLVATAPAAVLGVAAAAVGMQSIYAASTDTICGQQSFGGVVLLIVFGGAYCAARAVVSSLNPRR